MRTTGTFATALGVVAVITASADAQRPVAPPRGASPPPAPAVSAPRAPSGAKALFYGSSGASLQTNAPLPGPRMSRDPDVPGSNLATGFPTAPGTSMAAQPGRDYMGVSYWVELLEPSGQMRRVTSDHVFRAGDRIRLNVQSNRDGYLTVLNLGTTNRVTTLFPLGPDTGNAMIRAGQLYQVPPTAYLRFDNNPGEETILVLLSPAPLPGTTVASAPAPQAPAPAAPAPMPPPVASGAPAAPPASYPPYPPPDTSATPGPPGVASPPAPPPGAPPSAPLPPGDASSPSASPALPPYPPIGGDVGAAPGVQAAGLGAEGGKGAKSALVRRAMQRGAKDLVVEVDRTGPQPASYAVAPVNSLQDGGMISLQIKLRHN